MIDFQATSQSEYRENGIIAVMTGVFVADGRHLLCENCRHGLRKSEFVSGEDNPQAVILTASSRQATLALIDHWRLRVPNSRVLAVFCPASGCDAPDLDYFARGLNDYVTCPWTTGDLLMRLRRLTGGASRRALSTAPGWQSKASLIGSSKAFRQLLDQIPRIARSNATVLLTGETGTGKELIARAIHYLSPRTAGPFVPLNCGAAPDNLFENELFGHCKGAFTDAAATEKGLLAEAEGGTFFFDEIDSLSAANQVKILRFLQSREYRPLGGTRQIIADVRIVAASNANVPELVAAKLFREDLYHRLSVLTLHAPSLRERLDDIPLLVSYFLGRYSAESAHADCDFTSESLQRMMEYPWPGNVRELERVVQRAMILSPSPQISADELNIGTSVSHSKLPMPESFQKAKNRTIQAFELSYLTELLRTHHGNISSAARAAGKERRALQRLLEKHGLSRMAYLQSA
jgi:two-component system response regulator GlrR